MEVDKHKNTKGVKEVKYTHFLDVLSQNHYKLRGTNNLQQRIPLNEVVNDSTGGIS